jgi:hypothetical protein
MEQRKARKEKTPFEKEQYIRAGMGASFLPEGDTRPEEDVEQLIEDSEIDVDLDPEAEKIIDGWPYLEEFDNLPGGIFGELPVNNFALEDFDSEDEM